MVFDKPAGWSGKYQSTRPAPHNDGSGEKTNPRYIGTIAHVDHGKTALTAAVVNALRSQSVSHTSGEVEDILQTAKELRDNANGDCGAIQQAIHWEQKAAALKDQQK